MVEIKRMELTEKVCEELKNRGYDVEIEEFHRNNIISEGLVVTFENPYERAVVYSDMLDYYADNGFDLNDICDAVIEASRTHSNYYAESMRRLADPDYILENVTVAVCRADWNAEMLSKVPYRVIEGTDLVLYSRVVLDLNDDENVRSVTVTSAALDTAVLDTLGLSSDEVLDRAMKNFEKEIIFVSLPKDFPGSMQIVTNKDIFYGASAIAYPEMLRKVMGEMRCEQLVVIPSSVHEIIVLPYELCLESNMDISEMIKEVNGSLVDRDLWLSDHHYIFDGTGFVNIL